MYNNGFHYDICIVYIISTLLSSYSAVSFFCPWCPLWLLLFPFPVSLSTAFMSFFVLHFPPPCPFVTQ